MRFRVLVPPTWVFADLAADRAASVRQVVRGLLRGVAPDKASVALPILTKRFGALFDQLAAGGFAAVAVQAESLDEIGMQPMLVIRPLARTEGADPLDMVVALAAQDQTAELIDGATFVGVRTRQVEKVTRKASQALPLLGAEAATLAQQAGAALEATYQRVVHRSRYLMGRPEDADSWVEAFGSVEGSPDDVGEELAELYTRAFDVIVDSFSWVEDER